MSKFYVAAPYSARDLVVWADDVLRRYGHECTSTWATSTREIVPGTMGPTLDLSHDDVKRHALGDFDDIDRSDGVIMFASSYCACMGHENNLHTGGRHVEVGYALAAKKPVVIVGEPENVFSRALCFQAGCLDDAVSLLGSLGA